MVNVIEDTEEFSPEASRFRLDACLKKVFGKPLTEAEREVIRDVNRRNGWDKPGK